MQIQFDERGREIPDQTPVEMPIGYRRPLTMEERMQKYIREEMSRRAADDGMESFEEADDFDVEDEDEYDPISGYEMSELQEEAGFKDADPPRDPGKPSPDGGGVAREVAAPPPPPNDPGASEESRIMKSAENTPSNVKGNAVG